MNPAVESALISAGATIVSVLATATVAIVGFRTSRSTNQKTLDAAKAATDKTVEAARDTNKATIDAAHADIRHTLDATREGQFADRYTKAVEQLGSDRLDVRIGGIYALERVARDSARDHPAVMEVLTAFVRCRSGERWPPAVDGEERERSTRPDIQAAVTVVGRRDTERDSPDRCIDLTDAVLIRADLAGAKLGGAVLTGAHLEGADLSEAGLSGAVLTGAHLEGADLSEAALGGRADLTGAHLDKAKLPGAKLQWGILTGARLGGATLSYADLEEADLSEADLSGANLSHADLERADLSEADLSGADLSDADLRDVRGLLQEQLDAALGNMETKLPDGYRCSAAWST